MLPVVFFSETKPVLMSVSAVLRLDFDGETLTFKETGNFLKTDVPRGLGEGSIIKFKGKYYQTLRNDEQGYYSLSDDGINHTEMEPWRWDTGDLLPNYSIFITTVEA